MPDDSGASQKARAAREKAVGIEKDVGQPACCTPPTPTLDANRCKALLEKFRKEARKLSDDQGDPIKNGSEVNRRITKAYAEMYKRRPDLYWAGAATFVSKQMGCNMRWADSLGKMIDQAASGKGISRFSELNNMPKEILRKLREMSASSKKVLVRGNQAIFNDIYPQYRLYEESPQCATIYGNSVLPDSRMIMGFQAYTSGNKYRGMMDHADYEQNFILQTKVMENADLKQDVANFQTAQDLNKSLPMRLARLNQPEQASFSRECVAPGREKNPFYFKTPPGQFTDGPERWDMAVPTLNKYNDLMQTRPNEMNQAIDGIRQDMESDHLPSYDPLWIEPLLPKPVTP